MKLTATLIQWNGNNYIQVIQAFDSLNRELKIKVIGKRLVVRDEEAGFYRVFALGDILEVPEKACEADEPIEEEVKPILPQGRYEWSYGGVWGEKV